MEDRRISRQKNWLYLALIVALIANIGLWQYSHLKEPRWANVPAPSGENTVAMSFLGDRELAFRVWALALQNFGNTGGAYTPLKDYNYENLAGWFNLLDTYNAHSDFVPFLASYYFGATQNPVEQLPPVIAYLEKVGSRPEGEKWRWLAQAMYLARHRTQDMNEAFRLSKKLGSMWRPGMPAWTIQTQALISNKMGDKQASYAMLKAMIATEGEHMDPVEVNFMVDYICHDILTDVQAAHDPLCAETTGPGKAAPKNLPPPVR